MRQYRLVSLQLDHISSLVLLSVIVQQNQTVLWSCSFGIYLVHLCLDWFVGSRIPSLFRQWLWVFKLSWLQHATAAHLLLQLHTVLKERHLSHVDKQKEGETLMIPFNLNVYVLQSTNLPVSVWLVLNVLHFLGFAHTQMRHVREA